MKKQIVFIFSMIGLLVVSGIGRELKACTKEQVVEAVNEAATLLETKGEAGLANVGKLRFCDGNYVFVNDFKGINLMHIRTHLIGKKLSGLRDDKGKRFFVEFATMAKTSMNSKMGERYYNGTGWVEYRWPKPGEKTFSPKLTYIRGCLMGKKNVYLGAGIYQ
jgi:signal transduction histidine kinase